MNDICSKILDEMMVFADLGTDGAQGKQTAEGFEIRLVRNGDELTLVFADGGAGKVIERCRGKSRKHDSYRALLASERFGDLRSWAATQARLLRNTMAEIEPPIRVEGTVAGRDERLSADDLDDLLSSADLDKGDVQVMLINGPAGIGKTKFIESIALARTTAYGRRPLVLHVQSRGRVLSYLQDLMAFSLQSLRLSVTFDQVPILVRHGLVTLAVDGFDELGDPNGYELAWGQLNETISEIRGAGTLILAGRETFFGVDRLKSALTTLQERDIVHDLTLQPPLPAEAARWLREKGWSTDDVKAVDALLDEDYALRPFFLARLAEPDIAAAICSSAGTGLLSMLIDLMVERESRKFGDAVDRVLTSEERRQYAYRLLCEAAQYMADDESDIISETALTWLVDMALPKEVDPDVVGLLKNRAGVMAFLTNDALTGYRRFAHSQLLNYFLGAAVVESAGNNEVPKFVRRNIFSADFLAVFVEVIRHAAEEDPERVRSFFETAQNWIRNYQAIDRGGRNLGAWMIAALPTMGDIASTVGEFHMGPMQVDETMIRGTPPSTVLKNVFVNQIDIRRADLRNLVFEQCALGTVIVDAATRIPQDFPEPKGVRKQDATGRLNEDIRAPDQIKKWWLGARGDGESDRRDPIRNERHADMLRVLGRACRSSSFWIPERSETNVDKFVNDPLWPKVLALLCEHDAIREENKGVSGRRTRFVHIKQPLRILARDPDDEEVGELYDALAAAAEMD